MNSNQFRSATWLHLGLLSCLMWAGNAWSAQADLSNVPVQSGSSSHAKPNVMLLMDTSLSMKYTHAPDNVEPPDSGGVLPPPAYLPIGYRSYQCNPLYFNPRISYDLPRNGAGGTLPEPNYLAAYYDYYTDHSATATMVNLDTSFQAFDRKTRSRGSPDADDIPQKAYYWEFKWTDDNTFPAQLPFDGAICRDAYESTVTTDVFYGTPFRDYFANYGGATRSGSYLDPVSGTSRPGLWARWRVGNAQKTAFARWYSYYRTRLSLTKTGIGLAFDPIGPEYRVGFINANPLDRSSTWPYAPVNPPHVNADKFLRLNNFDSTQKPLWYDKLYTQVADGSSPMREGLARVGRHYALKDDGINNGMDVSTVDPDNNTCRQNFAIMLTDGYWNASHESRGPVKLDGTTLVGQQDGTLTSNTGNTPKPIWDGAVDSYRREPYVYEYFGYRPCVLGGSATKTTSQTQRREQYATLYTTTYSEVFRQMKSTPITTSYQSNQPTKTVVYEVKIETHWEASVDGHWDPISGCGGVQTSICRLITNTTRVPVGTCTAPAATSPNWITTTCTTDTQSTYISSCTGLPAANAALGEISVTCDSNTVSTNVYSCSSAPHAVQTGSSSNGWLTVSCTPTLGTTTDVGNCVEAWDGTTLTHCSYVDSAPTTVTACSTGSVSAGNGHDTQTICTSNTGSQMVAACPTVLAANQTCTATDTGWVNARCVPDNYEWWYNGNPSLPDTAPYGGTGGPVFARGGAWMAPTWDAARPITYSCQDIPGTTASVAADQCTQSYGSWSAPGAVTTCTDVVPGGAGKKVVYLTYTNYRQQDMSGGIPIGPTTFGSGSWSSQHDLEVPDGQCKLIANLRPYSTSPTNQYFGDVQPNNAGDWHAWPATTVNPPWFFSPAVTPPSYAPPADCTNWGPNCYSVTPTAGAPGSSNSLADVAQYYYVTDLRPDLADNVTQTGTGPEDDRLRSQHMTTFVVGLGVSGTLAYDTHYQSGAGDFASLRHTGEYWPAWPTVGKSWPVWPSPAAITAIAAKDDGPLSNPAAIDDFWHTAVNGRGVYFSASNAQTMVTSIQGALNGVQASAGAGAGAAVASQVLNTSGSGIYVSGFVTNKWIGDVQGKIVDTTGITAVSAASSDWSAQAKLETLVGPLAPCDRRDIRVIKTTGAVPYNLLPFTWNTYTCDGSGATTGTPATDLTAIEQAFFDASKVDLLTQYVGVSGASAIAEQTQKTAAEQGGVLVNYLRGQKTNADYVVGSATKLFRAREKTLGDIVNSQPAFVGRSPFTYEDAGHAAFRNSAAVVNRPRMLYVGGNDGMLHAFNAPDTYGGTFVPTSAGIERWAVIPSAVLPNLYQLADIQWSSLHKYSVDGSPVTGDIDACAPGVTHCWKTILVSGLNKGGKSYFALDVTNPNLPIALWEFNADPVAGCTATAGATTDCNLGYTFGRPVITKLSDGTWVVLVTSGYNNHTAGGDGQGYLYVLNANTGALIKRIGTGVGDATTPSGLRELATYASNPTANNTVQRVYGGDLLGNIWRFDINDASTTAVRVVTLKDADNIAGHPQPITNRMNVVEIDGDTYIIAGTGSLLGLTDAADVTVRQSVYSIRDPLTTTSPAIADNSLRSILRPQKFTTVSGSMANRNLVRSISCDTSVSGGCSRTQGWFLDLPIAGERVNIDMDMAFGTLVFQSNIPSNAECTTGESIHNYIDFTSGGYGASYFGMDSLAVGEVLLTGYHNASVPCPGGVVVHVTYADGTFKDMCVPPSELPPVGKKISWREVAQ